MAATTTPAGSNFANRIGRLLAKAPMRIVIIVIAFLWTLPTVGLLVSSFRPAADLQTTGWWTTFLHPFDASQWTIINYIDVITASDMGTAFLNSFSSSCVIPDGAKRNLLNSSMQS